MTFWTLPVSRSHVLRASGALLKLGATAFLITLFSACSEEKGTYYESSTPAADMPAESPPVAASEEALPPGHPPLDSAQAPVNGDEPLPPGHPPLEGGSPSAGSMDMSSQTLSPDMVARGDRPSWTLPEGWSETEAKPMRRANVSVGDSGLEVAVTSFPGNVGGLAANINRWRAQLGLPPMEQSAMLPFVTELHVDGRGVLLVDLLGPPQPDGPTQRMLTAVTVYEGSSWFFKFTGDAPLIEKYRPAYIEFVQSLKFAAGGPVAPL